MAIQSLYKDYFQKSKVFLYPVLDIKRVVSVVPIDTYAFWEGHYNMGDCKLSCLYHLRTDPEFRQFEKIKLFGNRLFHDFKQTADNKGIYIFDFSPFKEDWNNFLRGKYSLMSAAHKSKIKSFYGQNSRNYAYIESFLHPEKYYSMYSEIINVKEEVLKDVGQLCDRPDFVKETLTVSVKYLDLQQKTT